MASGVGGNAPFGTNGSVARTWRLENPAARWAVAVGLPLVIAVIVGFVGNDDYRLATVYVTVVVVVAVVAGPPHASLSMAISTFAMWYTVVPPTDSLSLPFPEGPISLAVFVTLSAAVIAIVHQRDREFDQVTELEQRYRRLASAGIVGIVFWERWGTITDANDAFLAMIGYSRDDLAQGRIDWRALTPPEYDAIDAEKMAELVAHGVHSPYEKEYVRADGSRVALLVGAAFLDGTREQGVSFMVDVTDRWMLESERSDLLDSERAARAEAQEANRRLEAVSQASRVLLDATGPDDVLRLLASSAVPAFGVFACVFVPEGDLLRRAACVHTRQPDAAAAIVGRFPVPMTAEDPVAEAFRRNVICDVAAPDDEQPVPVGAMAEYLTASAAFDLGLGVAVPLRARRGLVGVLFVVGAAGAPKLEGADRSALQEIANRGASVYLNALEFDAERDIASRLQQALLPTSTPVVEGHDIGACYVPATVGRGVGGDWWDVLELDGGRIGVVVGDVNGHGVHLAALMAELRNALRGLLVHGAGPSAAVESASRLLASTRPGDYATVFVAVYDPADARLSYCRAGHPPPVVLFEDETVLLDEAGGTLLGLELRPCVTHEVTLPDSFDLVAYTDGLVESPTHTIDEGIEAMARAARSMPALLSAQHRAERLVADLVGTEGRDDVCVVILSRRSQEIQAVV
jgi:PAS domain S-box-containing protein